MTRASWNSVGKKMAPRALFDATNLHVGGGVGVASSIVNTLSCLSEEGLTEYQQAVLEQTDFLVSTEVWGNLHPTAVSRLRVRCGNSRSYRWSTLPRSGYEVAVTVFGPMYRRRVAELEVVGFAQGRMLIRPEGVGLARPGLREKAANQLRWLGFARADCLVVETHAAARLLQERLPTMSLQVVPNTSHFATSNVVGKPSEAKGLRLAVVARDYEHKNLEFLGRLGPRLERELGEEVRFLTTLSPREWERKSADFRRACVNVGVQRQDQLPNLYRGCRASVFPSLLEIASGTPLDSLALGRPVFISDLPFFREIFGDAVSYFNPHDANAAAASIAAGLTGHAFDALAYNGHVWISGYPTARDRALAYLDILARGRRQ